MKFFKAFVFTLILFAPTLSNAQQLKSFSKDTAVFLEQLESFMESKERKKEVSFFLEEFTLFLQHGTFVESQFERIVETSNKLLKKRAKNYPLFANYFQCILAFKDNTNDTLDYTNWENAINSLADTRRVTISKIDKLLKITADLLFENIIYQSSTTHWQANTNNYKFRFEDKTIKIYFSEIDISCFAKKDSLNIYNTSGIFFPETLIWNGENGIVNWTRAGYSADSVFAELGNYKIDLRRSEYKADSVIFTHKKYFEEPLEGILQDKVMNILSKERAAYPKFDSYSKRFEIENIFDHVNYNGGFSMRGARFIGSGDQNVPAIVQVFRDIEIIEGTDTLVEKMLFFTGASKYYIFKKNGITGTNTAVSLKLDNDSIYHPGLLFRYDVGRRLLSLIRNADDENLSMSPYYNTYHKIDMDFEMLSWKIDESLIKLKMISGSAVNKAYFESENFFSSEKYTRVQGIDAVHPYLALYKFAKRIDSKEFTAEEYASFMRKSITQIRQQLILLSYSGVIYYDINTEEVRLKERLYHYMEARVGRRDYDVIDFNSETSGSQVNAELDLNNFDLRVYGVPRIFLSDSQNVIIYPKKSKILIKKNRDFDFAGKIEAGLFTFYGQNFSFEYDKFKIELNKIDSLRLKIINEVADSWGREMLVNVKSVIENITGELLIDNPDNKSGIGFYPEYPIFNSKQNSYVYFDKPFIQNGAYPRDKVFFVIDPYKLDSLDNFSTIGLGFEGTFESSDIIPTIRETLVVQDDNSLGFVHRTPPEGFPLYKGKGTFKNDIQISNHGLSGDGVFEYITSQTYSDDFLFFPDSMNANANQFINEKKIKYPEYPQAYGMEVYVHWLPNDDEYFIQTKKEAITMYDTKASIRGILNLNPSALSGKGKMNFDEGVLYSDLFKYKSNIFGADTADFRLKTHDLSSIAFKTDNVNTKVDFNKKIADFHTNQKVCKIELPQNKYVSYMENFTWFIDKREIEMATNIYVTVIERGVSRLVRQSQEGSNPLGSLFMSVHPKQDSLNFISPTAIFNVSDYIINAYDVRYIKVADGTVFPGDGEVKIQKNAKMNTLKNAELIVNDSTKYHRFYEANINIFGRLSYSGSGKYNYFDENSRKQVLSFDIISVDDSVNTYAKGKVSITQNFKLSPVFDYYGNISLESKKEYLTFSGYSRIQMDCPGIARQWIEFSTEINPNEIYLPISNPVEDDNNKELLSGVLMRQDSVLLFPRFLNNKIRYNDFLITQAVEGYLFYDKKDKKYKISSKEKLDNFELGGSYASLDRLYCNLYNEGKLDFGVDIGQVKSEIVGNVIYDINKKSVIVDAMIALDFFFAEQAITIMADTINADNFLRPINTKRGTFKKGMIELVGEEMAQDLYNEALLLGQYRKIPVELVHTILFTDVHLKWNQETSSFQSFGKIGIGNIMKTQINKQVDGHIEIQKKRSGDVITIYLEIDRNNWFFFNYKRGLMQAYASNSSFNEILRGMKASKRKMEVPRGEEQYMYFLSNVTRKKQFLRQFEEE